MNELEVFESPLAAVASPVTLTLPTTWAHCFIGVKLVDGSGVTVAGSTGSFAVDVYGPCSDAAQSVVGSPITVPARQVLSWAMNTHTVVVTPTGVTGAVQYKVVVAVNKN